MDLPLASLLPFSLRETLGDLPRRSSKYPVLLPAELSHSSLQSLMAFIPAERCLSLEPPTGLTSWTQLC